MAIFESLGAYGGAGENAFVSQVPESVRHVPESIASFVPCWAPTSSTVSMRCQLLGVRGRRGPALGKAAVHVLYRDSTPVVRTFDPHRVPEALFGYLVSHLDTADIR